MGYDIYASGVSTIPKDKVLEAGKAFVVALYKEGQIAADAPAPPIKSAKQVLALFSWYDEIFFPVMEDDGSITFQSEDNFRRLSEEEWIFEALGPFFDADSGFDFQGEDGAKWLWRFNANGLVFKDGETVYGNDAKAPHLIEKIAGVLYPNGELPVGKQDSDEMIYAICKIITDGGFGPFAGMTPLDMLATVVDDDDKTGDD